MALEVAVQDLRDRDHAVEERSRERQISDAECIGCGRVSCAECQWRETGAAGGEGGGRRLEAGRELRAMNYELRITNYLLGGHPELRWIIRR